MECGPGWASCKTSIKRAEPEDFTANGPGRVWSKNFSSCKGLIGTRRRTTATDLCHGQAPCWNVFMDCLQPQWKCVVEDAKYRLSIDFCHSSVTRDHAGTTSETTAVSTCMHVEFLPRTHLFDLA